MHKRSESGQAIVLLALAVVGLVGFTALAIDTGMVYSDRRHSQSASDAASLAGGGYIALGLENYAIFYSNFDCSSSDISTITGNAITTANNRAYSNDYTNAEVTVTTVCEDNGAYPDDKYIDINSNIVSSTDTSLVHLLYSGDAGNDVGSTVRIRPRRPLALGNAIVALNDEDCQGQQNGATFHGSAVIEVSGGGIWTNGCLRGNGGPDVDVNGAGINYVGQVIGAHLFDPSPQQAADVMPPDAYFVPPPDCSHASAHNVNGNAINGNLAPGLYCVSGEVKMNGNDTVTGSGVTLYLLDSGLTMNGNAEIQLTAPAADPDPSPALPGILILTAVGNTGRIKINGNSNNYLVGTILAVESDIDFLGNGNTEAFYTQIIGLNVEVGGNADAYIHYFDNLAYSKPSVIDMHE